MEQFITVSVNTEELDLAIKKATRLAELVREAQAIIKSLKIEKQEQKQQEYIICPINELRKIYGLEPLSGAIFDKELLVKRDSICSRHGI